MQEASTPNETATRSEHGSERRCLVRAESGPTDNLIRFVAAPDGTIVPDLAEKLPGRGLWVTADAACIETAITKKLFGRAAQQQVIVPATLLVDVRTLLQARVLNLLGLAKKGSAMQTGADAVRDAAGKGKLSYVLIAADASEAGAADMAGRRDTPTLRLPLTGAELGAAIGRESAVYMGLLPGKQAEALVREIKRLNGVVNQELGE